MNESLYVTSCHVFKGLIPTEAQLKAKQTQLET